MAYTWKRGRYSGLAPAKFPRDSTRTPLILYRVTNGSSIVRKHFRLAVPQNEWRYGLSKTAAALLGRGARDMELIERRFAARPRPGPGPASCGFLVNV